MLYFIFIILYISGIILLTIVCMVCYYVECNHNLQAVGKAARKPVGTVHVHVHVEGLWFG